MQPKNTNDKVSPTHESDATEHENRGGQSMRGGYDCDRHIQCGLQIVFQHFPPPRLENFSTTGGTQTQGSNGYFDDHRHKHSAVNALQPTSHVHEAQRLKSARPGQIVFDSSMKVVAPRKTNPRPRAETAASLQLQKAVGACLKHKATQKKGEFWSS